MSAIETLPVAQLNATLTQARQSLAASDANCKALRREAEDAAATSAMGKWSTPYDSIIERLEKAEKLRAFQKHLVAGLVRGVDGAVIWHAGDEERQAMETERRAADRQRAEEIAREDAAFKAAEKIEHARLVHVVNGPVGMVTALNAWRAQYRADRRAAVQAEAEAALAEQATTEEEGT